jgi:hypothetical protein
MMAQKLLQEKTNPAARRLLMEEVHLEVYQRWQTQLSGDNAQGVPVKMAHDELPLSGDKDQSQKEEEETDLFNKLYYNRGIFVRFAFCISLCFQPCQFCCLNTRARIVA